MALNRIIQYKSYNITAEPKLYTVNILQIDTYLLTCDTCGCLTLDQGIRSHGVDTS